MSSVIARARSFLFVPASQPSRFAKALDSGAGCVVIDLEDAIAPEERVNARGQLAERLTGFTTTQLARTLVRINACGTPWYEDDVLLMKEWTAQGLAGVMAPKSEAPAMLQSLGAALAAKADLIPLIESLAGVDAADLLARAPRVTRLAFGHLDFQLDMGMRCSIEETELASVRFALVAASRRAQIAAPVDGVTVDTADDEKTFSDAKRGRAFGFAGKLCIHPSQVVAVEAVFSPSAQEIAWARRVIEGATARGGRPFSLDGKMVDLPVVRSARKALQDSGLLLDCDS